MLAEYVAALGFTTARKLSEETTTDDDGFELPFWVVIVIVVLLLTCLLCGCTCFVIRCFAPEVTQGPAWEVNSFGTRWVRHTGPGDGKAPWVHEQSDQSYPGGMPVHDPANDKYDENNPKAHRRPANWQNKGADRAARQPVLDQLNGLMLGPGGGRLSADSGVRRQTASDTAQKA